VETIVKLAKENRVEKIVIGVPINMDGTLGFQAQDCIDFSQKILGFDIIQEDERLTSEEAENRLRSRKVDFRKNKGLVDMESASIILEQYLSRK
jgi:putative Holliday junction resolvase